MTGTFPSGRVEKQPGVTFTYVAEGGWKVCLE